MIYAIKFSENDVYIIDLEKVANRYSVSVWDKNKHKMVERVPYITYDDAEIYFNIAVGKYNGGEVRTIERDPAEFCFD